MVASLNTRHNDKEENVPGEESIRTVDPRISQHFVPIAPASTGFGILNSQCIQLPEPRVGEYELRPVLRQGCLCGGIRLLTNLR